MMLTQTAVGAEVYAEVDKKLEFQVKADTEHADEVRTSCAVKDEFSVDAASVIIKTGGKTLRLPKGPAVFDQPPMALRTVRECETERSIANIHGTFYEIPRADNMTKQQPLNFYKLRPIASHDRLITDFCTWRGLLVLAGCRTDAPATPRSPVALAPPAVEAMLTAASAQTLLTLRRFLHVAGDLLRR